MRSPPVVRSLVYATLLTAGWLRFGLGWEWGGRFLAVGTIAVFLAWVCYSARYTRGALKRFISTGQSSKAQDCLQGRWRRQWARDHERGLPRYLSRESQLMFIWIYALGVLVVPRSAVALVTPHGISLFLGSLLTLGGVAGAVGVLLGWRNWRLSLVAVERYDRARSAA